MTTLLGSVRSVRRVTLAVIVAKKLIKSLSLLRREKKKKKNKKEESSNQTPLGLDVEHHEIQDSSNGGSVEVSSALPVVETMEDPEGREISCCSNSSEFTGLVGNEASVPETGEKESKKRKSISYSLSDATNVDPVEVSKKRDVSDTGKSDQLIGLVSNERSVLEKSGRNKKKRNEESRHPPLLEAEGHGLQDTTNVEVMKESKKRKSSDSRNSDELNGLVRNEVSVLEKCEKKREGEKGNNHPLPVFAAKCATHKKAQLVGNLMNRLVQRINED